MWRRLGEILFVRRRQTEPSGPAAAAGEAPKRRGRWVTRKLPAKQSGFVLGGGGAEQTGFIPMMDLVRQQERISERLYDAVLGAMADAVYISPEHTTPFEEKLAAYCGTTHAVGVGSGTAALHLALAGCGIGPGHDVVTVPNSFFATAEVIVMIGASPRFVDVDRDTHLLALDDLPRAITDRTRAVLPVHLYGNVVDVAGIRRVLDHLGRQDVMIIEDCAHAMGARQRDQPVPLGTVGACSFNPGKNIGALGDGGAIVTSDGQIAETARLMRDHGRTEKNTHVIAGFNSRLSRINDRVLAVKIDYLDEWNDRRREIARKYDAALSGTSLITPVRTSPECESAYYQYVVCTGSRDRLRDHLRAFGIASDVHYPRLIPEQEPLRRLGHSLEHVPRARQLNRQILSLPCHPELSDPEADRVIEGLAAFVV
jgi:dTDP-4-amino-4,6-dideoxygalactose transaminase